MSPMIVMTSSLKKTDQTCPNLAPCSVCSLLLGLHVSREKIAVCDAHMNKQFLLLAALPTQVIINMLCEANHPHGRDNLIVIFTIE